MIFICTNNNDESTCRVIDWLNFYQSNYITLSPNDTLKILRIDNTGEIDFSINNLIYSTQNISSVWYRRGYFTISYSQLQKESKIEFLIKKLVKQENEVLQEYFIKKVFSKNSLSTYHESEVNKLEVLYKAKEIGITIPISKIISSKTELINFYVQSKHGLITKSIAPALAINSSDYRVYGYTELVDEEYINSLSDLFHPSLIQENIPKKFELRVFFIEEEFYSMAIFSQENDKTTVDYRHYDDERPNRFVTFQLPVNLKQQLLTLMKVFGLNNGSIDLIYGMDKQFYFIEVNPIGQYDMISVPCNMYLHKRIANYLIQSNEIN